VHFLINTFQQELLASEIAAYTYWTSIDKDLKGYMSLKDFGEFMKVMDEILRIKINFCLDLQNGCPNP